LTLGLGGKQLYVNFIALWSQNGAFKYRKVFKAIFFQILIYGHESWVMTEKELSQVQAAGIGFLRVHNLMFRDKTRSCEIRKALNVEPLLRIEIPTMLV